MSTLVNTSKELAKKLSQNEINMMNLLHSSFDISSSLYDFTHWLNSPEFINPKAKDKDMQSEGSITVNHSIAFENYNNKNGMGFGLRSLKNISKGEIIMKVKTELGFTSNTLFDNN